MELIGVKEIMELLGISRAFATHILHLPGCPVLPRHKGQTFRVPKDEFVRWWNSKGWEEC